MGFLNLTSYVLLAISVLLVLLKPLILLFYAQLEAIANLELILKRAADPALTILTLASRIFSIVSTVLRGNIAQEGIVILLLAIVMLATTALANHSQPNKRSHFQATKLSLGPLL